MTSSHSVASNPTDPVLDDPFFAQVLADPAARAAYEDAQSRNALIDALVTLRRAMHLTQTQIAHRMGVKQPMVSGFETESSDPRLSTVQRYARAVEATLTWRLTLPAHCDWIQRSDAYRPAPAQVAAPVRPQPITPLAATWASHQRTAFRRSDIAPAA